MFDYTLLFFYIVFQRNRGLIQDGVVGSNTWDWLLKELKCKDYGKGILKNKCLRYSGTV